jgi:hypothetical protein
VVLPFAVHCPPLMVSRARSPGAEGPVHLGIPTCGTHVAKVYCGGNYHRLHGNNTWDFSSKIRDHSTIQATSSLRGR